MEFRNLADCVEKIEDASGVKRFAVDEFYFEQVMGNPDDQSEGTMLVAVTYRWKQIRRGAFVVSNGRRYPRGLRGIVTEILRPTEEAPVDVLRVHFERYYWPMEAGVEDFEL